jgi:pimeloyl-ACP methyl ester carboxylesterase
MVVRTGAIRTPTLPNVAGAEPTIRLIDSQLDGAPLEVLSWGSGPGLVVVIGGGTEATTYRGFAERLSLHLPVHIHNRRGRGASGPRPDDYGLDTEVADLATVLSATGSDLVAGHSVGGCFALGAARSLPIRRLALYDPAVSVDGLFPSDFVDDFERAVAVGDPVETMLVVGKGLRNPGSGLPDRVQRVAARAILLTPPGRTMARLFPTVPAETRIAIGLDGPASAWADVSAGTCFFIGGASPSYYRPAAERLVAAMPAARMEVLPRLGHDAMPRATRRVVSSLVTFLTT